MPSSPRVVNHLPSLLRRAGVGWGELARRALLPAAQVARLRAPDANPRLTVAARVAAVLDEPVERVWRLSRRRRQQ
jgi:hypothetical protein